MPRIYLEEDLSLIQLDDDFTLEGIHIDSNVVYSGSKNATLKLSKFQGNAKFRIYNNSKFLLTIQPNIVDQINKIGVLSNTYVLKSGDRIDIVYDYDVKQWVVFGQWVSGVYSQPVSGNKTLTASDDGSVIEMSAAATLTVPDGLPTGFSCAVIPSGTTSIAFNNTTGNGSGSTITRSAASNAMFAIQQRASNPNSYVITGN